MKAKILNKVSLFLFFLLIFAVTVPGTAQLNSNTGHQESRSDGNQMNFEQQRNIKHTRFANQQNGHNYSGSHKVRVNVNRTFDTRKAPLVTFRPVVHRTNVIRANQFTYNQRVAFLPQNSIRFRGINRDYYFARGNFYIQGQRGFISTQIPLGATINFLPPKARTIYYGRAVYYQLGNVFLVERIGRRGAAFYEVAGYV